MSTLRFVASDKVRFTTAIVSQTSDKIAGAVIHTALKSWSVQRCVVRYQFTAHYTTQDNIALLTAKKWSIWTSGSASKVQYHNLFDFLLLRHNLLATVHFVCVEIQLQCRHWCVLGRGKWYHQRT